VRRATVGPTRRAHRAVTRARGKRDRHASAASRARGQSAAFAVQPDDAWV